MASQARGLTETSPMPSGAARHFCEPVMLRSTPHNMTGSQKCLAAPLGMGLVSVSPRAWEAMERRRRPATSYAYDLLRWREWWIPVSRGGKVPDGTARRQPVSIPTHLTSAMHVAVRLILDEGLPARFRRHEISASALRAGVQAMGLDMTAEA